MNDLAARPKGALFLDRDGVLNRLVLREGRRVSPRTVTDFVICPEAPDLLERVARLGIGRFVVTNQPDLARGRMAASELEAMHAEMRRCLPLTDVMYCPHDDADRCNCRKPKPGMLLDLAARWKISLRHSVIIGDTTRDIGAGRAAGCFTILIGDQQPAEADAHRCFAGLSEAIECAIETMLLLPGKPRCEEP